MKKNVSLKVLLSFALVSSLCFMFSCDVGMGEVIDVTAPVVQITSHKQNETVALKFELSGTYSDDISISSIEVKYTCEDLNDNIKEEVRTAKISGKKEGTWVCELEVPKSQPVTFNVYAWDKMRNESSTSKDIVALMVDDELPTKSEITIKRNWNNNTSNDTCPDTGIELIKMSEFVKAGGHFDVRGTNKNERDYFQNESMVLTLSVDDNYSIPYESIKLNLYEITDFVGENNYKKTLIRSDISMDEKGGKYNVNNPEFTITQEMLTEWKSELSSGVHYIYPEVVVFDNAGNQNVFDDISDPYVFAWESEYDTPKFLITKSLENGVLTIRQEEEIHCILFDDDLLDSYSWRIENLDGTLVRESGDKQIASGSDTEIDIITKNEGGFADTISDGKYKLKISVTDKNTYLLERTDKKTFESTIDLAITNSEAPNINITSPESNSTPALTAKSKFTLTGQVSDNAVVSKIAIAWCRDSNSKTAIDYFNDGFDFSQAINKNAKIEPAGKDLVIWNIGNDGPNSSASTSTQKVVDFTKEFDIYEDFKDAGDKSVKGVKVLVIAAKDETDNVTTEVHRLGAFNVIPKFDISISSTESGTYEPITQIIVSKEPQKNVYVKIVPTCDLELEEFKVDGTSCAITGYTLPIENPASDTQRVINYSAKDKFGNENSGTFTINFEKIPDIQSIVCNQAGETLRKNDKITLLVQFDKTVVVVGEPKLNIDCYKNNAKTGTLTATYSKGTDTNTLYFEATVPDGVEYDKIKVVKTGTNWINLTGASIKRYDIDVNLDASLTDDSVTYELIIDSKKPILTSHSGMRTGSTANFVRDTDGNIEVTLNFSEPVTNQNGSITIFRKGSEELGNTPPHTWHIPAVISANVFEKIWNNSSNDNRIVLSSSATEKSVMGRDDYEVDTIVSAGPYKMYTNGLKVNDKAIYQYTVNGGNAVKSNTKIHYVGTVMVPDITMKYVLDWQFDTSDTSDDKKTISLAGGATNSVSVNDIRTALEAVGYHKTTISLNRLEFNADRTSATLTIKDSDFIDGIRDGVEYIMQIPLAAFVDDVQNTMGEVADYTFSMGNVAKPTIRVRRWSTNSTTQLDPYHDSADADYTKAPVKIDCETPGAKIEYQVTTLTIVQALDTSLTDYQRNATPPDYMPAPVGIATSARAVQSPSFNNVGNLDGEYGTPSFDKQNYYREISAVTTYSGSFHVGEKNEVNSHRIYIASKASLASGTEMLASDDSYEGAFKTVLFDKKISAIDEATYGKINSLKIFAVQTPEGVSYTAGWPITMRQHWNTSNGEPGTRDGYKVAYRNPNEEDYTFISWELISDDLFTMTTFGINFQRVIDTLVSYGSCIWGNEVWCHH